jgi:hypothetical protein
MQIFLYKCEVCGAAIFSEQDHGRAWYARCIGVCEGGWQYHDKVIIKLKDFSDSVICIIEEKSVIEENIDGNNKKE